MQKRSTLFIVMACLAFSLSAQTSPKPTPKPTPKPLPSPSATPAPSPSVSPQPSVKPKRTPGPDAVYGNFGLGVLLGEPMSISPKVYLNDWNALDAGVGYSVTQEGLAVHADYLFHLREALYLYKNEIPPVIGVGAVLSIPRATGPDAPPSRIRIRFPVGLVFRFKKAALELGGEFVPMWEVHPGTGYSWSAGGSLRFFFK